MSTSSLFALIYQLLVLVTFSSQFPLPLNQLKVSCRYVTPHCFSLDLFKKEGVFLHKENSIKKKCNIDTILLYNIHGLISPVVLKMFKKEISRKQ